MRLHATFADVPTRPGGLSLLSESGMLGAVLVTTAYEAGLGLSSFLALGNRADVSGNDLLQYWEADDTTEVVGMYIESFGNPRNFSRLARRLTRVKPVVAVKARRLAERRRLDRRRHRGRPAAPDRGAAGADPVRARRHGPPPPRPAAAGRAAGRCARQRRWVARHRRRRGARPPSSSWPTWRRRRWPRVAAPPTPDAVPGTVDLGPHARAHDVERATAALVADPGVDAVLVLYAESLGATTDEAVAAVAARSQGPPRGPGGGVRLRAAPHPVGRRCPCSTPSTPPRDALGRVAAYAACWPGPRASSEPGRRSRRRRRRRLVQEQLDAGRAQLGDVDALALLDAIGLPILRTEAAGDVDEARRPPTSMGYPVVLKAAGRAPTAKTAAAGFAIDLEGPDALRGRVGADGRGLGDELTPVLVQPMVGPGVDVAIRVQRPPHRRPGRVDRAGRGGRGARPTHRHAGAPAHRPRRRAARRRVPRWRPPWTTPTGEPWRRRCSGWPR